ncbi:MAG: hypothetical protein JSV08_06710 [Acidobacteriota bacterium]|nr:MAG: hypothetical protein JSV08_06710 [Acidobacteriota bacterium]
MIKRQTRYHVLVAVVGVLVVAMVGSVIGSNMGFKMTRGFTVNANPAAQNAFIVAFPHHNPYGTLGTDPEGDPSDELLLDWWDSTNQLCITKYDNAVPGDTFRCIASIPFPPFYTFSGSPYAFTAGEGYKLEIVSDLAGRVMVGSHDPTFLQAGPQAYTVSANPAAKNAFMISVTPNSKYGNLGTDPEGDPSDELLIDWWDSTNQLCITKYDNAVPGDTFRCIASIPFPPFYTFSGSPYALTPGEGYWLEIVADVSRPQSPYY